MQVLELTLILLLITNISVIIVTMNVTRCWIVDLFCATENADNE